MSDEQPREKRDVDRAITLDAYGSRPDADGSLANGTVLPDLPSIDDIAGLGDLHTVTAELTDAIPEPPSAIPPQQVEPVRRSPRPPITVANNLRLSKESNPGSSARPSSSGQPVTYPAALVPNAVSSPISPTESVRVPGQQRRRSPLPELMADLTERRWFWASAGSIVCIAVLGLLTVTNMVSNPFDDRDRSGIVADGRLTIEPGQAEPADTSVVDETSSSTGAGANSGAAATAADPSAVEAPTTSAATTVPPRTVSTAAPTTVRTTTTVPSLPSSTTTVTSLPSSVSTSSSVTTTSTVTTTESTTSTSAEPTTTTDSSSSTDTSNTTTTTDGSSTTESSTTATPTSSTSDPDPDPDDPDPDDP